MDSLREGRMESGATPRYQEKGERWWVGGVNSLGGSRQGAQERSKELSGWAGTGRMMVGNSPAVPRSQQPSAAWVGTEEGNCRIILGVGLPAGWGKDWGPGMWAESGPGKERRGQGALPGHKPHKIGRKPQDKVM